MMRSVIYDYVIHKYICDNCIVWMDKLIFMKVWLWLAHSVSDIH